MSIASILEQLRREYVPDLRAEVAALAAALDANDLVDARRLAHRIAGTAGSYGFGEASKAARTIEHALAGNDPTPIAAAIAALKAVAESA